MSNAAKKKKDSTGHVNFYGADYGDIGEEYPNLVIDGNNIHTADGEQLFDPDAVRGIKDELFDEEN